MCNNLGAKKEISLHHWHKYQLKPFWLAWHHKIASSKVIRNMHTTTKTASVKKFPLVSFLDSGADKQGKPMALEGVPFVKI